MLPDISDSYLSKMDFQKKPLKKLARSRRTGKRLRKISKIREVKPPVIESSDSESSLEPSKRKWPKILFPETG
jgi:hypothetical protein